VQPKVDILVNCFNGEKYLPHAFKSISSQTYPHWRVIFIDNCSTDNSAHIAKNFKGNIFYYKTDKILSLGEARRIGVEFVDADFLAFLDCDDIWMPNKLSEQINIMKDIRVALTYSGMNFIDENHKVTGHYKPLKKKGFLFKDQLINFDINILTALIRRDFLIKNNLNFSSHMKASEEYNLFMQISALGEIFACDKIHANYRILEDSLTNTHREKWSDERDYTLNQIINFDKDLFNKYKKEFETAKNRSKYYKACFFMESSNYASARSTLRKIAFKEKKYFLLYIVSFSPILWRFIHKRKIKEKLTRIIFRFR
tara:strand:- start:274 stop:1212 length:939 start_codon:yes stop_codon:yes gene_type:complete